ncbi:MAG: hypothetical protein ACREIR_17270 [Geminicoccaceae bacterium]
MKPLIILARLRTMAMRPPGPTVALETIRPRHQAAGGVERKGDNEKR